MSVSDDPSGDPPRDHTSGTPRRRWPRWARAVMWSTALLAALVMVVAVGAYAWLYLTLAEAGDDPGIEEARQALAEPVSESTTTTTGSLPIESLPATDTPPVTQPQPETTPTTAFDPGSPGAMNILVLGADRVSSVPESRGRSDTMMLVHVDPEQGFVSVLSFPRDLRVDLGSHGPQKLNAAYAYGGDAMAIRTIRDLTGVRIDHYARVDFSAFRSIVDELGGIYVDVDRRYADNGEKFLRINLQPGYQRLDGDAALRYVRTRHDLGHDWSRIQRQQRFLRAAKEQVFSWDMARRVPTAVSTMMEYVATEIGPVDAVRLAWWGAHLDTRRVKQVVLEGRDEMIDGSAFVVASDRQVRAAVQEMRSPPDDATVTTSVGDLGPRPEQIDLSGIKVEVRAAGGADERLGQVVAFLAARGAQVVRGVAWAGQLPPASTVAYPVQMGLSQAADAARVAQALGVHRSVEDDGLHRVLVLVGADLGPPDPGSGLAGVEDAEWRYLAAKTGFPIVAAGWIPPRYDYAGSRVYEIDTEAGPRPALNVLYKERGAEEFLSIMQTTFTEAPVALPGETVVQGGTLYTIVWAGRRTERVWWREEGVLYWVSNSLGSALSRDQLLKVATSMTPPG